MSVITISGNSTITWDGSEFKLNSNPLSLSYPLTVQKTTSAEVVVTMQFTAPIDDNTASFVADSSNLVFDGSYAEVFVSADEYTGILSSVGPDNVVIKNLTVTVSGAGAIVNNAGWLVSTNAQNVTAINCRSNGAIPQSAGGIIGPFSVSCNAFGCFSTGVIGEEAGGIIGQYARNATIVNCGSTGVINDLGGGILGRQANSGIVNGLCTVDRCYSTGTILTGAGGLIGAYANPAGDSRVIVTNCFSTGNNYYGSGIAGILSRNTFMNNCFVTGKVIGVSNSQQSVGIAQSLNDSCINNCYVLGDMVRGVGLVRDSNRLTINNCYVAGNIGSNSTGMVVHCTSLTITNCYTLGTVAENFYSIVNPIDPINADISITNCYSLYGPTGVSGGNGIVSSNVVTAATPGVWRDSEANNTIGLAANAWYSALSNTPFLLSSFNSSSTLSGVPGFMYNYVIPSPATVTTNGLYTYQLLSGQYDEPQSTVNPAKLYNYNIYDLSLSIDVTPPKIFRQPRINGNLAASSW